MNNEPEAYRTYLLRLWRARRQGKWQWHASLESPRSGERQVFAGLPQLLAFLSEQCDEWEMENGDAETRRQSELATNRNPK